MKKLALLLTVFAFVITSCSSADDSGSQDPVIGTWTYHKSLINGIVEELTTCEKQETFTFSTNETFSYQYFEENQGVCEIEESTSGTWTNDGNSIYTLTIAGESNSEELTFENNTFYLEYTDTLNPIDPILITYREVYIKN